MPSSGWCNTQAYTHPAPVPVATGATLSLCLAVLLLLQWANDSTPGVQEVFKQSLHRLEQLGAATVNITLPELDIAQVGHDAQTHTMLIVAQRSHATVAAIAVALSHSVLQQCTIFLTMQLTDWEPCESP